MICFDASELQCWNTATSLAVVFDSNDDGGSMARRQREIDSGNVMMATSHRISLFRHSAVPT